MLVASGDLMTDNCESVFSSTLVDELMRALLTRLEYLWDSRSEYPRPAALSITDSSLEGFLIERDAREMDFLGIVLLTGEEDNGERILARVLRNVYLGIVRIVVAREIDRVDHVCQGVEDCEWRQKMGFNIRGGR